MNREVVLTYLQALQQSTVKKGLIIEELIKISKQQEKVAQVPEFDINEFTQYMDQKEKWIEALSTIDNGFGQTFDRIKDTIISAKELYRKEIEKLQTTIAEVTSKAIELQTIEKRNKLMVDRRIAEGRRKIKQVKVSNKAASSYYKNMANVHYNQSYFLDSKK